MNYLTTEGDHGATCGKKHRKRVSKAMGKPKGITPLTMSVMELSGLMPFKTNRFMPTGGVINASSRLSSITTLNQMGSKPTLQMSGKIIGKAIKIMETDSKIVPKNKSRILMAMKTNHLLLVMPTTDSVRAWGASKIVSTKPNRLAPIMIAKIIQVVLTVSFRILGISIGVRVLYTSMVMIMLYTVPMAAASVGVKIPV